MKRVGAALGLLIAACGGNQDAPRPIAPSGVDDQSVESPTMMTGDDDADGIPNEHDDCPLAAGDGSGFDTDGCPDTPAPDAGTRPF